MLVISTLGNLKAQEVTSILLYTPKFVYQSSPFEVAFVSELTSDSVKNIEYLLGFDKNVKINEVNLSSGNSYEKINFQKKSVTSDGDWYSVKISPSEQKILKREPFQILVKLSTNAEERLQLFYSLNVVLLSGKQYRIKNKENNSSDYFTESIHIYRQTKKNKKSLQIGKDGFFEVASTEHSRNIIYCDFWMKSVDIKRTFLSLNIGDYKIQTIKLGVNENRFFTFFDDLKHLQFYKKSFLSNGVWNHFILEFDKSNKSLKYYLNGELIAISNLSGFLNNEKISFKFSNKNGGSLKIDNLRLTESNISDLFIAVSKGKNREFFKVDSLFNIAQFNFEELPKPSAENIKISLENVNIVKSDSPIFPVAPELDVTLLNGGCRLEWLSSENEEITTFSIEKSFSGSDYQQVSIVPFVDKVFQYSFIDNSSDEASTVYYRIKQINKDGSVVFSSTNKIGKGNFKTFSLLPNYPNPFNPKTLIRISVLENIQVQIMVYSLEGKVVQKLYDGELNRGEHQFEFDGSQLPSGIYLYTITTPFYSQTRKMILAK